MATMDEVRDTSTGSLSTMLRPSRGVTKRTCRQVGGAMLLQALQANCNCDMDMQAGQGS